VFASLPFILARPYVGVLVFAWLGYMNPQKLSWGFATVMPFAYIVALTTLVAMLMSQESKRFPISELTIAWLMFIAWMGITTIFAFYQDLALLQYQKVLKIQVMSFAIILLITDADRLRKLLWVIVGSLGFYGVKGGIITVLSGGAYHVWGPDDTFIGGNNEIALALLMVLPLMQYLRSTSPSRTIRMALLACMFLCGFSVLGSQSRGALVGGIAMALLLAVKSKHRLLTIGVLAIAIPALVTFMPEQWAERMRTIESYQTDSSAMSRIVTWKMAYNLANDRLLGGGFELWTAETFERYSTEKTDPHDGHSIYFKVLGEHGWIGLALFLIIGFLAWRTGSWVIRETRNNDALRWLSELARMCQVSLTAFAVGGAFLGLSYFDLYWNLIAILVICKLLATHSLVRSGVQGGQRAMKLKGAPTPAMNAKALNHGTGS
jgi:probable O-glycosylation ligase (exosortase A-associated)